MKIEQKALAGEFFDQKILEQFAYLVEQESAAAAKSVYESVRPMLNLWQKGECKTWFESMGYFVK